MKNLVFLVCFMISTAAVAGVVNLNVGETITIQSNTQTVVTCGGADAKCMTSIKNLNSQLKYCKSSNESVEDCLNKYWPLFKRSYPTCIDEAFESCLSFCKSDPFGLECLDLCK